MKNITINKEFYINNRKKLAKELKPGSMAVVISNDAMPTNADGLMKFKQNTDFLWRHWRGTGRVNTRAFP